MKKFWFLLFIPSLSWAVPKGTVQISTGGFANEAGTNLFTNVKDMGAKGNGTDVDTVAFSSAIARGGTIFVPYTTSYYVLTSLIVNRATTTILCQDKAELRFSASGKYGLAVTSSNVVIDGCTITGPQGSTTVGGEDGIVSSGTSHTNRIFDVTVQNCFIKDWGYQGIRFDYVTRATALNNTVWNIRYAGIQGRHVNFAKFGFNTVYNITDQILSDGIVLTGTSAADAIPKNGSIFNNIVSSVQIQGINVEPAQDTAITGNPVTDCYMGITVENQSTFQSRNVSVTGNVIKNTAGPMTARKSGILVGGHGLNFPNENISVTGNTIEGYGTNSPVNYGAMYLYYNLNSNFSNNVISSFTVAAINLDGNVNCRISGNQISSNTSTGVQAGILATATVDKDNYTLIDGNNFNLDAMPCIKLASQNGLLQIGKNYCKTTANPDLSGVYGATGYRAHHFLFRDPTVVQVTGGTAETNLSSMTVAGASMGRNETIRVTAFGDKSGAGGNKTIKAYFGTASHTFIPAANNTLTWKLEMEIQMQGNTNEQIVHVTGQDGTTVTYQALTNATEDTTADVSLRLTGQLVNAGDAITQRGFIVERF